jgi:hypothetical protein
MRARGAALVGVVASFAAGSASGDIGLPAAVALCRAQVPEAVLFGVERRERDLILAYEGEMYDAAVETNFGPRFDAATGAPIGVDVDGVDETERPALLEIMGRLGELQYDFPAALALADDATGRSDATRIRFDIEAGILAFEVEYAEGEAKVFIDGATGGVIPHHGADDDMEPTLPSTTLRAGVALAESTLGAGWHAFRAEAETEGASTLAEVLLFNVKSGMLAEALVAGDAVVSVAEFSPAGSQAAMVAELQANWPSVATGLAAALDAAEAEYPGAGINEVELEIETEKTGTSLFWKVGLITADLIEIDFFVDAAAGGGNGLRFATAPVNPPAADLNGDGVVNAIDLAELLAAWGSANPMLDLDSDGAVGAGDIAFLLADWR